MQWCMTYFYLFLRLPGFVGMLCMTWCMWCMFECRIGDWMFGIGLPFLRWDVLWIPMSIGFGLMRMIAMQTLVFLVVVNMNWTLVGERIWIPDSRNWWCDDWKVHMDAIVASNFDPSLISCVFVPHKFNFYAWGPGKPTHKCSNMINVCRLCSCSALRLMVKRWCCTSMIFRKYLWNQ